MQQAEYIDLIKKRLKAKKYELDDGGYVKEHPLSFVASRHFFADSKFFFIAIFDNLDMTTLKNYSFSCYEIASESQQRGIISKVCVFSKSGTNGPDN